MPKIEVLRGDNPDTTVRFADAVEIAAGVFEGRPVLRLDFKFRGTWAGQSIVLEDPALCSLGQRIEEAAQVACAHDGLRISDLA